MPQPAEIAEAVAAAPSWDARVAIVRRVPEDFGIAQHSAVYAAIARRFYQSVIEPDFAYVHWRDEYELAAVRRSYEAASAGTQGFTRVTRDVLAALIADKPVALRVFRLLLGLTASEFCEACTLVAEQHGVARVGRGSINTMEAGGSANTARAQTCATVIDLAMTGALFPAPAPGTGLRRKSDKPDTAQGWESVRRYAADGVPLDVFLHQRAYGGAFRQLLDATSSRRGDILEVPVTELFDGARIPFIRTGAHNQAEIVERFRLTVRPAPDFVIFDPRSNTLRAILECKVANDGGTARDKAARFGRLREESQRLGGVPVIAVLGGIGWRRAADALGPVIASTDGRTFTVANLDGLLEVDPFPGLRDLA